MSEQSVIVPEVGKWYELEGGAIVPCLLLPVGQSEVFCIARNGVYDTWSHIATVLREVSSPHLGESPVATFAREVPAPATGVCVWSENEDGQWDTTCGACWEFMNEGTPADNGVVYCHKCGNHVEAKPYTEKEVTE